MWGWLRSEVLFSAAGVVLAWTGWAPIQQATLREFPSKIPFEIVHIYPHDNTAFTQGLFFDNGFLFEGTGRRGQSVLRRVVLESGMVAGETPIPDQLFGEGIAQFGGHIYQLTWTSGFGFIYDTETLHEIGRFQYPGEGWGLTADGRRLIMSDGSSTIRFLDPDTLAEVDEIQVHDPSGPIDQLNELEYIRGEIFANVWHRDEIVRISSETGQVTGRLDLGALAAEVPKSDREAVLNGIAFDPDTGHLFVTGKLWPAVFELRLLEDAPD